MFWAAIVYRNSEFSKEGTLDVMLYQKYIMNGTGRVWVKPLAEQDSDHVSAAMGLETSSFGGSALTAKCLVMTPMGNGYNAGMVNIPQVGTVGLVAEIELPDRFANVKYIWLGGLYGNLQYGQTISLPSDDTINDDINFDDQPYIADYLDDDQKISTVENQQGQQQESDNDKIKKSEYIEKGAFIIKTKTDCVKDEKEYKGSKSGGGFKPQNHDWTQKMAENTFVLSKDKAALRHSIPKKKEKEGEGNQTSETEGTGGEEQAEVGGTAALRGGIEQLILDNDKVVLKRKIQGKEGLIEQILTMTDEDTTLSVTKGSADSAGGGAGGAAGTGASAGAAAGASSSVTKSGKSSGTGGGDEGNSTIIKLKTNGDVEITTTGKMDITSKKEVNFSTDKDFNINAKGKINFTSKDMMNIHGKDKNLSLILNDISQILQTLTTQGSPSSQAVQPTVVQKAAQVSKDITGNYSSL